MNIIHIAPEIYPFARRSSIAESIGRLPAEQSLQGHSVSVFSPLYAGSDRQIAPLNNTGLKTWVDAGFTVYEYELFESYHAGVKYVFFKNDHLFGRAGVYGAGGYDYADNDVRFGTFCQAAMNYIRYHNVPVELIHCHDWSAALTPVYKKIHHGGLKCKTVVTVHSVENLGIFNKFSTETLNLPWEIYTMDFMEYYDNICFLKGGLAACDAVTTPSPVFAAELASPESDADNFRIFAPYSHKLTGILHGIDYDEWSPETDPFTPARYSAADISGKILCKETLCAELGLIPSEPLACYVAELVPAKGRELILKALNEFENMRINLIIVDDAGNGYDSPAEITGYSETRSRILKSGCGRLAHMAYAAADIILSPSFYEPWGSSQLIGMKYGAIPVSRSTGGLKDGIKEAAELGAGFSFEKFEPESMLKAMAKAAELLKSEKRDQAAKILMQIDHSWARASKQYISLYKKLLEV